MSAAAPVLADRTWFERDTTPAAIEAALRQLLVDNRHGEDGGAIPARVLNLVTVVDRQWRGEIENRLERVEIGRAHV